jgi:hypothetical protein
MAGGPRGRKPSAREAQRARVLAQWRGIGPPLDPNENVSRAGDLLSEIFAKLRLEEGIEESQLRGAWREVAGEFVAAQTEPVSLQKGVLTLKVLQPSMRFHLEQSRGQILQNLQQALGKGKVRDVRLTIG